MKQLFFSLLAMTSCVLPQVDPITKSVMNQNKNLQAKYHLKPSGFGTIGPGTKAYILEHDYYHELSINEARALLVNYVEDLKNSLNSDFASQALHSPIDEHFLSVSIGFKDTQGRIVREAGKPALISLNKGMVAFAKLSENSPSINYETFQRESYREAIKRARSVN
jgi:hypothetical protein